MKTTKSKFCKKCSNRIRKRIKELEKMIYGKSVKDVHTKDREFIIQQLKYLLGEETVFLKKILRN